MFDIFRSMCEPEFSREDIAAVVDMPFAMRVVALGLYDEHIARDLVLRAKSCLTPDMKAAIKDKQGYMFHSMLDCINQEGYLVYMVFKGARMYCAKVVDTIRVFAVAQEAADREVLVSKEVHSKLRCPTLIKVLDSFNTERHAVLILPLLGKSASDLLLHMPLFSTGGIGDEAIAAIAVGVLASLAGLALTGWCHGNVKPSNVMFCDEEGRVVVIDLGSCTRVGDEIRATTPTLSLRLPMVGGLRYDLGCLATTLWLLSGQSVDVCSAMRPVEFLSEVNKVSESDSALGLQVAKLLLAPVAAGDVDFGTLKDSIWPAVLECVGRQLGDAEAERLKAWWPSPL